MARTKIHLKFLAAALSLASLAAPIALQVVAQNPAPRRSGNRPAIRPDIALFRDRVARILTAPEVSKAYWGLFVQDADTGEVLFAQNADHYFLPASNAKLFTAALVMATLGPDYRFHTTLETRSAIDANGALQGDLVLIGRGDPNLSNRKVPFESRTARDGPPEKILAGLADAIVARGIKQIAGDVIADDSYFAGGAYPSGWAIDDMLWSYGVPVSAIEINEGALNVQLVPADSAGLPAIYTSDLLAGIFQIHNLVTTVPRGAEYKIAVERDPGSPDIFIRGSMPVGTQPRMLVVANDRPADYAAALLKNLLEARGIQILGKARARHSGDAGAEFSASPVGTRIDAATVLADHISQPLSETLRVMDKVSQNLHAEMYLRTAAREKTGDATADAAVQFEEDFRNGIGITDADAVMSDASGLSRKDMLTPESEVMLLLWAAKQPWFEIFRASLPIAGVDGTLTDRMAHTSAAERIFAKTGSLSHVDSL
ncbi:MAG TPA: D-alanyl-D-alanine carboxypeptidase/D-alanyl-D-alanine-endopeptidase, partial [Candidatus Acidoferrum sp.]|nr:D-alanyl-D-alanine carboxypeptidase/D-alanyl-D-alanine-endopeptidase [Candidatus Acidoferrum sp.]